MRRRLVVACRHLRGRGAGRGCFFDAGAVVPGNGLAMPFLSPPLLGGARIAPIVSVPVPGHPPHLRPLLAALRKRDRDATQHKPPKPKPPKPKPPKPKPPPSVKAVHPKPPPSKAKPGPGRPRVEPVCVNVVGMLFLGEGRVEGPEGRVVSVIGMWPPGAPCPPPPRNTYTRSLWVDIVNGHEGLACSYSWTPPPPSLFGPLAQTMSHANVGGRRCLETHLKESCQMNPMRTPKNTPPLPFGGVFV